VISSRKSMPWLGRCRAARSESFSSRLVLLVVRRVRFCFSLRVLRFSLWSLVLLVDECTSGVDPLSRRSLWKTLTAHREECCILFTTHVRSNRFGWSLANSIASSSMKLTCLVIMSPFWLHLGRFWPKDRQLLSNVTLEKGTLYKSPSLSLWRTSKTQERTLSFR